MSVKKGKVDILRIRKFAAIVAAVMLSGLFFNTSLFSAKQEAAKGQILSAPLPTYTPGTVYVYSDRTWEKVVSAGNEKVSWYNHRGYLSSGLPDFTYRRAKWETRTRQGTRTYKIKKRMLLFRKAATSIWPLRKGNRIRYYEKSVWREKGEPQKNSVYLWSYEVLGVERVSVMAGNFDAFKIVGKRYFISKATNSKRLRETKTWFYAPEVGHFILTISKRYNKAPRQIELMAILPPQDGLSPAAQYQMDRSLQTALEFKTNGESVAWSDPGTGISGGIKPLDTFKLPNGTYCRRYVQKLNLPSSRKTFYGMAFRDSGGTWVIPRL